MPQFRFTTRTLFAVTLLFAVALCLYAGRRNSHARFSLLTQGLSDRFEGAHYPLTQRERQLTDSVAIPSKNWIVMFGDMKPPEFWSENIRKCEIGTGLDRAALTCEVYFTVSQSQYALYANPAIAIEYFPDDRAPNEQLAIWFHEFIETEYDIVASMNELSE
jgi:hypothetical protein